MRRSFFFFSPFLVPVDTSRSEQVWWMHGLELTAPSHRHAGRAFFSGF